MKRTEAETSSWAAAGRDALRLLFQEAGKGVNKRMGENTLARTSGIGAKDKIGYAMGDVASCLVFGLTQSILNKYYTDILQVSVLSVMIMTIIARIWDAVNDPMAWQEISEIFSSAKGTLLRP